MKKSNKIKIGATLIFSLCLTIANCANNYSGKKNPIKTDVFYKNTGIKLPSHSNVLNYKNALGLGALHRAIILMDLPEFTKWIAKFSLTLEHFSEEKRYLLGPNSNWWNPQESATLPTTQIHMENGMAINLGYKYFQNNKVLVYFLYSGT